MLAGLGTYLYGYRYLPARVASDRQEAGKLTSHEWYLTMAVIPVIVITVFQSISQYQEFNVFPVWIQQHVARQLGGYTIPIPVVLLAGIANFHFGCAAADSAMALAGLAGWSRSDLSKIGIGAGTAVLTQLDFGGGEFRVGRRARSPGMAGLILRGDGHFVHVLLAHNARAGVPCPPR